MPHFNCTLCYKTRHPQNAFKTDSAYTHGTHRQHPFPLRRHLKIKREHFPSRSMIQTHGSWKSMQRKAIRRGKKMDIKTEKGIVTGRSCHTMVDSRQESGGKYQQKASGRLNLQTSRLRHTDRNQRRSS